MAGYEEENQDAMNGYEEDEEEVEEEVEEEEEEVEVEEERPAAEGARDGGGGGEAVGSGEAGGVQGGGDVPAEPADGSGKIFVGGVAWETTEEKFTKHFQKYGAITDSVIMKDKHTGMPRGFGFVTFSDPSVIDRVLEDEHNIDGRTVEVKRTVPRQEMSTKDAPSKTRKIFIGGIPASLTEDKLKEHFSSYGKVAEHQIMVDHSTGRSRGFGFVTFESEDAVERVMSDGRMHDLGGKQVEIKRAEPKKPGGGDSSSNSRHSHGGGGHRSSYRGGGGGGGGGSGGGRSAISSSGGYGYGADYRSTAAAYYGNAGYGAYGRGYGAYGGNPAYGSGFGSAYGGSIYGAPYGAYGAYGGAYGGGAYGAPGGYGAGAGGYGGYSGAGGMGGGGSASGRGPGRYHPYGK